MKKFFLDNTLNCQSLTREAAKDLFQVPSDILDKTISSEKFIVIYNYKNEEFNVQIAFNILASYSNNSYLVLVFDKNEDLCLYSSYPSHTQYPPVWNREFGYIDYTDFLGIQKKINEAMVKSNLKPFYYDFSLENRSFYFTQENPVTEIPQLLKEGKPYSIIGVFAWKKPELAEIARKIIGI